MIPFLILYKTHDEREENVILLRVCVCACDFMQKIESNNQIGNVNGRNKEAQMS